MALAVQNINLDSNMNNVTTALEEVTIQPHPNKNRQKEDNINKLFDSSKRKISSLDSQRIIGVLEDLIRKTEIITLLPFIIENIDRYSIMLGTDLCTSLQEYDKLQIAYSKACAYARRQARGTSSRPSSAKPNVASDSEEVEDTLHVYQQRVKFLSEGLSNVIKTIIRKFKLNPTAMETIKGENRERASEANTYIDELRKLQEMIFNKLVTGPVEEIEKHKLTVQMMTREKKAQSLIKKLEFELKQGKKSREDLVCSFSS